MRYAGQFNSRFRLCRHRAAGAGLSAVRDQALRPCGLFLEPVGLGLIVLQAGEGTMMDDGFDGDCHLPRASITASSARWSRARLEESKALPVIGL